MDRPLPHDSRKRLPQVVPRSHRGRRTYRHRRRESGGLTFHEELADGAVDLGIARDVILEPGQMPFHDVYLAHGNAPNPSGHRRAGFVCRYMPTASVWDQEAGACFAERSGVVDFATGELFLIWGRDRSGRNGPPAGRLTAELPTDG